MIGAALFIGMCLGIWIGWRACMTHHTTVAKQPPFLVDID